MIDIDNDDEHFEMWNREAVIPVDDDLPPEFLDKYISAHVLLLKGDSFVKGQVIAHMHDADGNARGRANSNPILDLYINEVQFISDVLTSEYVANVIAEAIYVQMDDAGHEHLILD